jgi:methionyl-tRNA formyltransferase
LIVRVAVLTTVRRGTASACLPSLVTEPGIEIALVLFSEQIATSRKKRLKRRWRKIRRIGPLGALTGLYLRTWRNPTAVEDVFELARRFEIPIKVVPRFSHESGKRLLRESGAELGLTLGTALIPRSVFEIPEKGMVNVHGDVLPRFRGGQSVIWPIYEGVAEAGFSIHRIDRGVDTGDILHVERFPIRFHENLRETYRANVAEISRRVPTALARCVADLPSRVAAASAQSKSDGTTYTTPTLWQFLRMLRQHRRLRRRFAGADRTD